MNFKNFITKSIKLRPEFEENFLVVHLPWKEQYDILIGGDIPEFIMEIYSVCNGTDPDENQLIYKYFIPNYRILKIQEAMKLHGEFVKKYNFKEGEIIPFLVNDKDEHICYRCVDGVSDIVHIFDGTSTTMYDSTEAFWKTLCDGYDENIYGLDFKNCISVDVNRELEIAKRNNPKASYWN